MKYYSVLNRKETLTHTSTWVNLKAIMFSKISLNKRINIVQFHLYEVPGIVKFIETES
jgi:hypothetical protein